MNHCMIDSNKNCTDEYKIINIFPNFEPVDSMHHPIVRCKLFCVEPGDLVVFMID